MKKGTRIECYIADAIFPGNFLWDFGFRAYLCSSFFWFNQIYNKDPIR